MRKILIVDCFDSFTFNIFHYLDELNDGNCTVIRYDDFNPKDTTDYTHVVLSPGPGLPQDYPLIQNYLKIKSPEQSLLGVCLGHQAIAVFFNGELERLDEVQHGLANDLLLTEGSLLFNGFPDGFKIGHYHSWVVSNSNFPEKELKITSKTQDDWIMSFEHRTLPIYAVQFHPESVLTQGGKLLFKNWLELSKSS